MNCNTALTQLLNIKLPVIMAPMFLVSNKKMMEEAMNNGIAGCFPTLNYRKEGELKQILQQLNQHKIYVGNNGTYGVNLIVQKTNPLYKVHLKDCIDERVPFFITSLGNPKEVIDAAHSYGGKVFCDVTNLQHAAKCASLNADGFIAVCQGAGGHAGPYPFSVLIPALKREFPKIPVIAAGGIATGSGIISALAAGAEGVSIGTRFIACTEATVQQSYKDAVVNSGMDDIVLTERLSGTPCNIIDTPYAKKIGYKQNFFERWLNTNSSTKKYFKTLVQYRGFKKLEDAVKPGNYNNLWSAGQSVELIRDIKSVKQITDDLVLEMQECIHQLNQKIN